MDHTSISREHADFVLDGERLTVYQTRRATVETPADPSAAWKEIDRLLPLIARGNISVLVLGETGAGCGKSCTYQPACLYSVCQTTPTNTSCAGATPVTVATAKNELIIGTLLGVPKTSGCSNGLSSISPTQEVFYEITTAGAGTLTAKVEAFLTQPGGNSATTSFGPSIEFRTGTCASGTKTTCAQVTRTTTVAGPTTLWLGVIAAHNGGSDGAFALTVSLTAN